MLNRDKAPRAYAAEIIFLPTRAARRAALDEVPAALREWVRFYVVDWTRRRRCRSK